MTKFTINCLFIFTLLIIVFTASSCRQDDTDNRCRCIASNGNIVLDTIYHMEYDLAYQICEAKEGTENFSQCECSKLE